MALENVLGSIPGLAGYLGVQDYQRQKALGDLQGVIGLLGAVRQEQQAAQEAQLAPLKLQMVQAQTAQAQRTQEQANALDAAISRLPPEQQAIARMNPSAFAQSQLKQGEQKVIPAGGVLVQNGAKVYDNPKVEPKSNFEKALDAANITDPKVRQQLLGAYLTKMATHAPAANTNVVMNQEKAESAAVGKASGEQFNAMQQAGADANGRIGRFDRIGQLLEGINTGKLTPAATQVSALADSLGIKIDPNLGTKQAAQALSNEIALTLRNPSGGAGMPGALSDSDRQFLQSMTPSLANSPEGNRLIIETAKKLAKRDQEVAKLARDYRAKNGTFKPEFYNELEQFSAANPLFPSAASAPNAAPASNSGWSIKRK